MKTVRLFLVGILMAWHAGHAQQILDTPWRWIKPSWSGAVDTLSTTGQTWVVFSDRDENPAYLDAGSNVIKTKVQYMDRFYVSEKEGTWLHIYKDGVEAEKYKTLGPGKEDVGWINIQNLLPNRTCLLSKEKVSMKAMILTPGFSEGADNDKTGGKELRVVQLYQDPASQKKISCRTAKFQIFYVYKHIPELPPYKSFLLGTSPQFREFNNRCIAGWIDARKVMIWNNQLALITNTDSAAVKERKISKNHARVFLSVDAARKYRENISAFNPESVLWEADSCPGRKDVTSYSMRFPVLSVMAGGNPDGVILQVLVPIFLSPATDPSPAVTSFLLGQGISAEEISQHKDAHRTIYCVGYTPLTMAGNTFPLWEKQYLLGTDEIYRLVKMLENIDDRSISEKEMRENVGSYFQNSLLNESIEIKSNADAVHNGKAGNGNTKVTSISCSDLARFSLQDIADPAKVSNQDIKTFLLICGKKYRSLNSIYQGVGSGANRYIWISDDNKYYWIPQRLFP